MRVFGLFWAFVFLIASCENSESKQAPSAEDLYGTYLFTKDDALLKGSSLVQFSRKKSGKGVYLPAGSVIKLDGDNLHSDSISIGEVYYEQEIPAEQFAGLHQVILKNSAGKEFLQNIQVEPVALISQVPQKLKREQLEFIFTGINEFDHLQVAFIDTSFSTNDFHQDTVLPGNRLRVAKSRLSELTPGPLTLYFMVEKKKLLTDRLPGETIVRYVFRRDSELVD